MCNTDILNIARNGIVPKKFESVKKFINRANDILSKNTKLTYGKTVVGNIDILGIDLSWVLLEKKNIGIINVAYSCIDDVEKEIHIVIPKDNYMNLDLKNIIIHEAIHVLRHHLDDSYDEAFAYFFEKKKIRKYIGSGWSKYMFLLFIISIISIVFGNVIFTVLLSLLVILFPLFCGFLRIRKVTRILKESKEIFGKDYFIVACVLTEEEINVYWRDFKKVISKIKKENSARGRLIKCLM